MQNKKTHSAGGLVYSTDPNFKIVEDEVEEQETLSPSQQKLKVLLDKKQRAGKSVTLVQNFTGKQEDRETLGKQLKGFCGTGGSVKDGDILIQGDNRDKVLQWLQKNGYLLAKKI
jgi:translation initiation factor 1